MGYSLVLGCVYHFNKGFFFPHSLGLRMTYDVNAISQFYHQVSDQQKVGPSNVNCSRSFSVCKVITTQN